ncbi:MAG TPA: alanine--tRNA ligase-related protein, partial [Candidatus Saccharimonadales bacterium]|nr:alanine--tRNA ligase-related protein [Candidatus Saccharimonadales bacterium]
GYVLRRLVRRAVRYAFDLGIEQDLCAQTVPIVNQIYEADFPEVSQNKEAVIENLDKEEKVFRQTLRKGLQEFPKLYGARWGHAKWGEFKWGEPDKPVTGDMLFKLYDTYGFPVELSVEEAKKHNLQLSDTWKNDFSNLMQQQRERSQTAAQGMFRGGLADHSEEVVKLHTVTHLMYQALKNILGGHVVQRGSNITAERTRFDFSHPEKLTPEQIKQVEDIVNQKIAEDLPVSWQEEPTNEALQTASGAFGDKYGDKVKVYTIGEPSHPFSREICGGPHVEHTGQIGEGGKRFKISKEESSSAGVRRIKAALI